jgi:hypothetical protein
MAAVLGALVMFGGAGAAHAESRESCYRKVRSEQRDLDRAIQRHGYRSRQAEKERRELARAQDRCDRQFGRYRDRDRDYRWR